LEVKEPSVIGSHILNVDASGTDEIKYWSLGSPWDFTNITEEHVFTDQNLDQNPNSVFYKTDGSQFFILQGFDEFWTLDLGTSFDLSTATVVNTTTLSEFNHGGTDIWFANEGSKLYFSIDGFDGDAAVREYDLSTPWDITTRTLANNTNFAADAGNAAAVYNLQIKPDGSKIYLKMDDNLEKVYEYDLSTSYDISTATLVQSASVLDPFDHFYIKPDTGDKMYYSKNDSNIYIRDFGTPWDVSTLGSESSQVTPSDLNDFYIG
jgi:hypothetical protein